MQELRPYLSNTWNGNRFHQFFLSHGKRQGWTEMVSAIENASALDNTAFDFKRIQKYVEIFILIQFAGLTHDMYYDHKRQKI